MISAESLWHAMNEGKARSKPPTIFVTDHCDFAFWLGQQDPDRVFDYSNWCDCALAHYAADRLDVDLKQQPHIKGEEGDDSFVYYGRDGVKIEFGWPLTSAVHPNLSNKSYPHEILSKLATLVSLK